MTQKRRFKMADWVALGQRQLAEFGVEGVKLETLCAQARLTRGSFYHHFEDHAAFLLALTRDWAEVQTQRVAARMEGHDGAEAQAAALTDAAMRIDYRLELGIRELARRHAQVAAIVDTTDAQRLDILAGIYASRFQMSEPEARRYAFLEYAAFCGMILLEPAMDAAAQKALATTYDNLVQRALGTT